MAKVKRSKAEMDQLLQTVQMFEVIAETQPNDVQSLEILKEAYLNLDRDKEAVATSKKIAKAYLSTGQLSSAILEYEGILQRIPNDAECLAALADLEGRMGGASSDSTVKNREEAARKARSEAEQFEDPNEALLKFLQTHQVVQEKDVANLLSGHAAAVAQTPFDRPMPSIIDLISERGISSVEKTLNIISEQTRHPFIPLTSYELDSTQCSQYDRETCCKHLILPFDQISKTLLIATANPFDTAAQQKMESITEGRIQWFLTEPVELRDQLKNVFRIPS